MQISLIHYFINRSNFEKAEILLFKIENNTYFNETINDTAKIENNTDLIKIYLIKAKLAKDKLAKQALCQEIINTIEKNNNGSKSIKLIYPLVQAYTCLNKVKNVSNLKNKLTKLGITNFDL